MQLDDIGRRYNGSCTPDKKDEVLRFKWRNSSHMYTVLNLKKGNRLPDMIENTMLMHIGFLAGPFDPALNIFLWILITA